MSLGMSARRTCEQRARGWLGAPRDSLGSALAAVAVLMDDSLAHFCSLVS